MFYKPHSWTKRKRYILLDKFIQKIRIHPETKESRSVFETSPFYFYTGAVVGSKSLQGYKSLSEPNKDGKYASSKTWQFNLPLNERIVSLATAQKDDTIASLGRVLGDRTVMYKYLNPNLLAFLTEAKLNGSRTIVSYLLDTVSGSLYYRASHPGAGPLHDSLGLSLTQCENFVVYTYWNYGPTEAEAFLGEIEPRQQDPKRYPVKQEPVAVPDAKGLEVVVLELFEHSKPDKRVVS